MMKHGSIAVLFLLILLMPSITAQEEGDQSKMVQAKESAAPPVDASSMAKIVVMANGRMKPLATHARESLRRIFSDAPTTGEASLIDYVSILLNPGSWMEKECLVSEREVSLEYFDGRTLLSPNDVLTAHMKMNALIQGAMNNSLDPAQKELADQAMALLNSAYTLHDLSEDFRFLPMPGEEETWLNPGEARWAVDELDASLERGANAFDGLKAAYLQGDATAFDSAVAELIRAQRGLGEPVLSPALVTMENLYYMVDVKKVGLILFCLSCFLYLAAALRKCRGLARMAFIVLIAGTCWNSWIIGGRTAMAGQLPLKNLNEVYLVVLFFLPFIGLLMEWIFKSPLYSAMSVVLSVVGYIGALFLPVHGYEVAPPMAILVTFWREIHILTIMLSYAILLVAVGFHVAYLLVRFLWPAAWARSVNKEEVADDLNQKAYLMVAWGFLFLTAGIATGAAWAHSSWGRYWAWDPKEVWATVAWSIYAFFLHMKVFFRVRGAVLALINIIGFAAIIFTYFGVTYLLGGLHAYS